MYLHRHTRSRTSAVTMRVPELCALAPARSPDADPRCFKALRSSRHRGLHRVGQRASRATGTCRWCNWASWQLVCVKDEPPGLQPPIAVCACTGAGRPLAWAGAPPQGAGGEASEGPVADRRDPRALGGDEAPTPGEARAARPSWGAPLLEAGRPDGPRVPGALPAWPAQAGDPARPRSPQGGIRRRW